MKHPAFIALASIAGGLFAAEVPRQDIKLNSGETLRAARIISIGKETVSISHEKGIASAAIDDVPLDILARAHMALEESAKDRAATAESAKAADEKRRAEQKAAASVPPSIAKAIDKAPVMANLSPMRNEQALIDLKAAFPVQTKQRYRTRKGTLIEFEVPSHDVYSQYKGMVAVSTVDNAPSIAAQLDKRAEADIAKMRASAASAQDHERPRYEENAQWLGSLRSYLAKLKQVR